MDVSCLNRPFDDLSQPRVKLEADAVDAIIEKREQFLWELVSSEMVIREISIMADDERRRRVMLMLEACHSIIPIDEGIVDRAFEIKAMGFRSADAAHVAAAEANQAGLLLTCDDKMVKLARRHSSKLKVEVRNPLSWLQEVLNV
ncbi:MAG: PIN domain-containing protein [Gemmatales bacterium]